MTIQTEQYAVSSRCIMTYMGNIITVKTHSDNHENRERKECVKLWIKVGIRK